MNTSDVDAMVNAACHLENHEQCQSAVSQRAWLGDHDAVPLRSLHMTMAGTIFVDGDRLVLVDFDCSKVFHQIQLPSGARVAAFEEGLCSAGCAIFVLMDVLVDLLVIQDYGGLSDVAGSHVQRVTSYGEDFRRG